KAFSTWKRYYFTLNGRLLTYYKPQRHYQDPGGQQGSPSGPQSGPKGVLDLDFLLQVTVGRRGIMKANYPFKLTCKNLPSVKLAAETSEVREKWVRILQDVLQDVRQDAPTGPERLSSSDNALSTPGCHSLSPSTQKMKSATLPGGRVSGQDVSSSTSGEEESQVLEPQVLEPQEEPQLIKPKKILRVPVAGPLYGVNIAAIKLKSTKTLHKEVREDTSSSSSDQDDIGSKPVPFPGQVKLKTVKKQTVESSQQSNRTLEAGEIFGVKLKKVQKRDEIERLDSSGGQEGHPAICKRPQKRPFIPLNNSSLLNRTDISQPQLSAGISRSPSPRKRSPSPSIPLSRSVHALTKSVEGPTVANSEVLSVPVRETGAIVDAARSNTLCVSGQTGASVEGKRKVDKDIRVHHAVSREIKYSVDVEAIEVDPIVAIAIVPAVRAQQISQQTVSRDDRQGITGSVDRISDPDDDTAFPVSSSELTRSVDRSSDETEFAEFEQGHDPASVPSGSQSRVEVQLQGPPEGINIGLNKRELDSGPLLMSPLLSPEVISSSS
ncbi:hypothetical protein OTU49_012453, partial [Cherax quadricarinatus]